MNKNKHKNILCKISLLTIMLTISSTFIKNNNISNAITINKTLEIAPKSKYHDNDTLLTNNLSSEEKLPFLAELAHTKVNKYRDSKNLPPLKISDAISEQAKIHSENMATGAVEFSHDGFQERINALKSTISYRTAAENVAFNMGYENPVEKAVEGWIDSTGHRQNMEGNFNLTGIGVAKNQDGEYYFTQIFVLEKN